jgi:DNA-binding NtrC family response regulator
MPKKIIMCVDDEQVVLTSLIGQLNNTFGNKYIYEGFTSAEEAKEYIDELYAEGQTADLIVCDWLMPRVTGDEFMIRVHKRFPHVQMIMLSGQADQASVERAKTEAKLYKFVAKPWDKDELMHEVETALNTPKV